MGQLGCVRELLEAGADVAQAAKDGWTALMAASRHGKLDCVRALLEAGADVAQADANGWTALIVACEHGLLECVYGLFSAGATVVQATQDGWTALMAASSQGQLDCVRALLEFNANPNQVDRASCWTALVPACLQNELACVRALLDAGADMMYSHHGRYSKRQRALEIACGNLEMLQLFCAYAPSHQAVRAHPIPAGMIAPECAQWLEATRRWTSQLHHFEFLPIERVRALLVEGADVAAGDGEADAPTPVGLAAARLLLGDGRPPDSRASLIASAAAPWSPRTHALFPAGAKARAVELLRIGLLLARRFQGHVADAAPVEVGLRDAWLDHVMPHAFQRSSV
jgi:hypothetical protein